LSTKEAHLCTHAGLPCEEINEEGMHHMRGRRLWLIKEKAIRPFGEGERQREKYTERRKKSSVEN
jgi:hypothetical protein